jgi:hypothetical protein
MRMPSLFVVPVAMALAVSAAQARSSAPSDAAGDVRELAASIESIHPDPFRSVTKKRFHAEVDAVARQAPVLTRDELLVGLLRIIALLGPRNGHTGLFPLDPEHRRELHLYPIRLYAFADGIFVVDEGRGLGVRGSRLVTVDGMPVDQVLARVEQLVSRDNPSNLRGLAPHYLLVAEVLDGLGVTDGAGPAEFGFERTGGELVTRTLASPGTSTSPPSVTPSTVTIRRSFRGRRVRSTSRRAGGRSGPRPSREVAPSTSATTPSSRRPQPSSGDSSGSSPAPPSGV